MTRQDIKKLLSKHNLSDFAYMSISDSDNLEECLMKLDQDEIDIVNLYHWCGKSHRDIGIKFNRSREWARKKLNVAYKKMCGLK